MSKPSSRALAPNLAKNPRCYQTHMRNQYKNDCGCNHTWIPVNCSLILIGNKKARQHCLFPPLKAGVVLLYIYHLANAPLPASVIGVQTSALQVATLPRTPTVVVGMMIQPFHLILSTVSLASLQLHLKPHNYLSISIKVNGNTSLHSKYFNKTSTVIIFPFPPLLLCFVMVYQLHYIDNAFPMVIVYGACSTFITGTKQLLSSSFKFQINLITNNRIHQGYFSLSVWYEGICTQEFKSVLCGKSFSLLHLNICHIYLLSTRFKMMHHAKQS